MRHTLSTLLLAAPLALSAQDSLNVRMLFHWDDPTIPIGIEAFDDQYSAIWGYVAEGREYAFIGSSLGVHVFDVTEPAIATQVDFVAGRSQGAGIIAREYKTYQHYLYAVSDQAEASLQVIDLQYLPDSVRVVYDENTPVNHGHTLAIDTANARLYISGGDAQFRVFSLADPEQPLLVNDCMVDVPWWQGEVGYVHDCYVRDNIVWTDDTDALHVIDFTDALDPVILGSLTSYPDQGYNHSSWLNDAGTVLVMADETHGSPLKFVDATDLSDLQVISSVTTGVDATSMPHNPFFVGDIAHVACYYDGYWLWNATIPTQPVAIGYYDTCTEPNSDSYRGAWGAYPYLPSGHVLVSDMQTGLWVFDIDQAMGIGSTTPSLGFRISPTHTNGPVTITTLGGAGSKVSVDVFDASGALVMSHVGSGPLDLDLSDLNDGVYVVRASNETSTHTQRVVKMGTR